MGTGLLYGLAIIFVLYLVPRLLRAKRYSETSYYQITQKSHSSLDAGERGEYQIFKELAIFENQGGKLLFNLYVPKPGGKTTEIDVILIHPKGFFVIESKNYKGWITEYINEDNKEDKTYWKQTLPVGHEYESYPFYSPVLQNDGHIKYLKPHLESEIPANTLQMWSVIVFSDRCTFEDVTVSPYNMCKVIQLHQLKPLIGQCTR